MMSEDVLYVRKTRAMRVEGDCAPVIGIGLETREGQQYIFTMADVTAYEFIRRMTEALFEVEAKVGAEA
jgi:hypothetical protein